VYERQRRLILAANMIGCRGYVQREGQIIHLIAEHLIDLSALLGGVGERDESSRFHMVEETRQRTEAVLTRATHSGASRGIR